MQNPLHTQTFAAHELSMALVIGGGISGIEASLQPVELKNMLREDKKEECFSQEEALSLSEHKKDGYFKGPRAV